jgi:hypothetical protein
MKRWFLLPAALAAALLIGCAQARAGVNASVSIDADAGATAGLSSSPTVILQDLNDNGSGGAAAVGYGWPPAAFPQLVGFNCPSTGCADKSAGGTAAVDESAGVLRAGAAASVLVGNAPDFNYGGIAFVESESSVDDGITLSAPATVILEGTVHGSLAGLNGDPVQLSDPSVETDVKVGFCCERHGEAVGLIGGYNEQFFPDAADGATTPISDTFSIPVDLPAGYTEFQADLAQDVHMLVDGMPGMVLSENGLADFTGTVTFKVIVPDDVVATSDSGLLPIVGGAAPAPSDTAAPTSAATVDPAASASGWNNGPVTVHIAATDETGGSGVASISVVQDGSTATTAGSSVDVPVPSEGATTLTYYATDAAGNQEAPQTLTVQIDETAPTVSYDGNAGTYTVDQQVSITCGATDAQSGVAASTCADVTGPAYSFALGTNTLTATATDNAGNTGCGQTSFTVVADPAGVAALTARFITSSAAYSALSPQRQRAVDNLIAVATRAVARIAPTLHPAQETALLRIYGQTLVQLERHGWLTAAQVATLTRLAAAL